jgi:hypothetical protein
MGKYFRGTTERPSSQLYETLELILIPEGGETPFIIPCTSLPLSAHLGTELGIYTATYFGMRETGNKGSVSL